MTAAEKLRETGLKLTPQRLAILQFFEGNMEHPSADDVFQAVHGEFPTMSMATVYTTLTALRDHGIIRELTIDGSKKRYDPDTTVHHHIMCSICKRIFDISENIEVKVPANIQRDYIVTGHHVEIQGTCPDCKH